MEKKFGWVIKDFSSLQSEKCYSVPVLISDCKWQLLAYPKGNNCDYFSLYLDVCEAESLPCGWRRFVNLRLSIINQHSQKLSILKVAEAEPCFDGKYTTWGFPEMLPLSKLSEDGGFLVNGEVLIVAELNVFEVINTANECNDLLKKTSPPKVENSLKFGLNLEKYVACILLLIFVAVCKYAANRCTVTKTLKLSLSCYDFVPFCLCFK